MKILQKDYNVYSKLIRISQNVKFFNIKKGYPFIQVAFIFSAIASLLFNYVYHFLVLTIIDMDDV